MVNFGGHLKAVREVENEQGANVYFVPYDAIKQIIYDEKEDAETEFREKWLEALNFGSNDFIRALQQLWETIFAAISDAQDADDSRGTPAGSALQLYVETFGAEASHELLTRMTQLHIAAVTNSEGLRKLVKKYDKYGDRPLSSKLLPILYSADFFTGQTMLVESMGTMRELLRDKDLEDEEDATFLPMVKKDSETNHAKTVENRILELDWLKRLVAQIPEEFLLRLVAHRGFHHIGDRNDKRPLENSLAACELAWISGVHLCECDIALTKDEKLVLAHDEDFKRLALDSSHSYSSRHVSDLTLKELISLPLKSGLRPPLLIDVLRSALAISDHAKLIIEIKPGNALAASALARLLLRHPELCSCVAMIMSFDAVTMHRLRAELYQTEALLGMRGRLGAAGHLGGNNHQRHISFDHFGTLAGSSNYRRLSGSTPGLPLDHQGGWSTQSLTNLSTFAASFPSTDNELPMMCLPKLMLLTVAEEPKKPCELRVSVDNLSPVEGWLTTANGSLDGVYLQFQKEMMTPKGAEALKALSQRYSVGCWGHSGKDPDDFQTFCWLVTRGNVTYVNTDLPVDFHDTVTIQTTREC